MCLFTLPLIHPPTHTHSHMKNIDQGVLNCIGVNKSQEFFLDITTIWYEQPTISIYKARKKVKYSAKRQWKWCYESFNRKKGKKISVFSLDYHYKAHYETKIIHYVYIVEGRLSIHLFATKLNLLSIIIIIINDNDNNVGRILQIFLSFSLSL